MSNKKTRKKGARTRQAPSDPMGPVEGELDDEVSPRLGALVLAIKVLVGVASVLGLSSAFAFGLYHYARTTPRFAVEQIAVLGTRRLARDAVLAQAGLAIGKNVFLVDVAEAERRLRGSPWIRSARVRRHLPGRLEVEIQEREPVAILVLESKSFLVSSEGEPFKDLGLGDPHDLPVITGVSIQELGRDRRAELERVREALALLSAYAELPLARQNPAEEVHLTEEGGAVLIVGSEGLSLHLGTPPWTASLHRAARIVRAATEEGGRPGVVFLDSEAHPERAVVRLR